MTIIFHRVNIGFVVLCIALTTMRNVVVSQEKEARQQDEGRNGELSPGSALRLDNRIPLLLEYTTVTITLFAYDQTTYDFINKWRERNPVVRSVSSSITEIGNGVTSIAIFGALFGYSELASDETANHAAVIGIESFALSGATVQLVKHLFSRERPNVATVERGEFHGLFAHFREWNKGISHFDAFPSGHSATVFAAATALTDSYKTPAVTIGAYSLAVAVGISRITEKTHWASDVFVGALIGYYSAKLVERWNRYEGGVTLAPEVGVRGSGIHLTINF